LTHQAGVGDGQPGVGQDDAGGPAGPGTGLPHIELDAIYHQPGCTPLATEEFRRRVTEATGPSAWVVDGNYVDGNYVDGNYVDGNYSAVRDLVCGRWRGSSRLSRRQRRGKE